MKTKTLGVRLSADEWETLARCSLASGEPVSVFVRRLLGVQAKRKNGRPKSMPKRVENGT